MSQSPGFPSALSVRIVHGGNLPPGLHLGLPGSHPTPPSERVPHRIYLEDFLPQDDRHHAALGVFVDTWDRVETAMTNLIAELLGVSFRKGAAVFQNLSVARAVGTITALSTAQLTDEAIAELVNLLERVSSLNGKRNALIHGVWTLEFKVWGWKGEVRNRAEFSRETMPHDFRVRGRLTDLRNQKERSKHVYGVKRIRAATQEAHRLAADLAAFTEAGMVMRPPSHWQVSEFLSPLHPQTRPALSCRFSHRLTNPLRSS